MYKNYLSGIHLPKEKTDFANIDVSYLLKEKYDSLQRTALTSARMMTFNDITNASRLYPGKSLRFPYETPRQFRALAAQFGLMKDIRVRLLHKKKVQSCFLSRYGAGSASFLVTTMMLFVTSVGLYGSEPVS
jgi:hypothetical protein